MVKIVDGRVVGEHIIGEEVTPDKLTYLFQSGSLAAIGSVAAWVSFPVAYGQVPAIVASPAGLGTNAYARVSDIETGRFRWIANAPGSANWIAYGVR